MTAARQAVAAHTQRIRAAGGKRTSVDLTPAALIALEALRSTGDGPRRSTSETICAALIAANQPRK